jgi:hypothetical protein
MLRNDEVRSDLVLIGNEILRAGAGRIAPQGDPFRGRNPVRQKGFVGKKYRQL